ncbi:MAG: citrate lyase holo-[acyl-carrier protein] synthase [Bacillota bacterium]|nr:citrate lyase holo-[acyl-carrier protein] synthase [Bacillota bacterium]
MTTPQAVTAAEMMAARELRAARQRQLQQRYPGCAVSLTLNVPGEIKLAPDYRYAFDEGCAAIERQLRRRHFSCGAAEYYEENCGYHALWPVAGEALQLKQALLTVEDEHPLGRLFDIDVLTEQGRPVSRTESGHAPRLCLLCERPAHLCVRARTHSLPQLLARITQLIGAYRREQQAARVMAAAGRALFYELAVTPKPGLVDRADSGAHTDMDFFTFIDSGGTLLPWFTRMFYRGYDEARLTPEQCFARLRYLGMEAEDAMLAATGGVNTHKGLLFSLGLLCAAAGRLLATDGDGADSNALLDTAAAMAAAPLQRELAALDESTARSGGERLYVQAGGGARAEAASGFATVRRYGLPALQKRLDEGRSLNDAGALTLLDLLAHSGDSNIFARGGRQAQQRITAQAAELARREPPPALAELTELNRQFIAERLSPGGSADLLAITFFVHFMQDRR